MLKLNALRWFIVATCVTGFPVVIHGQESAHPSTVNTDQMFSVIQNSLTHAADNALDASNAEAHKAKSAPSGLSSMPQAANPTAVVGAHKKTERIDAMRSLVQPILAREGVPVDLSAVIEVESAGNPFALSPKGARGLWQLMPETARRYGLQVDSNLDERLNIEKSTTVAARYLRDLHAQFGSWPLALAAYNTGELNLQRAINHARSSEFVELSFLGLIPIETRNYVPAVLAAMRTSRAFDGISSESPTPKRSVFALSALDDSQLSRESSAQSLP